MRRVLSGCLLGLSLSSCFLSPAHASWKEQQVHKICTSLGHFVERKSFERDRGIGEEQNLRMTALQDAIDNVYPELAEAHIKLTMSVYANPSVPPAVANFRFKTWCLTTQPMGSDPLNNTKLAPWIK